MNRGMGFLSLRSILKFMGVVEARSFGTNDWYDHRREFELFCMSFDTTVRGMPDLEFSYHLPKVGFQLVFKEE